MKTQIFFALAACLAPFGSISDVTAQSSVDASTSDPVALKLLNTGSAQRVELSIVGDPHCFFGDMDAMFLDKSRNVESKLILSIEPLVPTKDFPTISKPIEDVKNIFDGGYHASFDLPKLDRAVPLGVYLCFDSTDTGRCGGKEATSIMKIIKEYEIKQGRPPKLSKTIKDRIYFFRFLMLERDTLSFFHKGMTDARYETLRAMVQKASAPHAEQIFAKVKKLNILQSMPLRMGNDHRLELVVPFYNPPKCSAELKG